MGKMEAGGIAERLEHIRIAQGRAVFWKLLGDACAAPLMVADVGGVQSLYARFQAACPPRTKTMSKSLSCWRSLSMPPLRWSARGCQGGGLGKNSEGFLASVDQLLHGILPMPRAFSSITRGSGRRRSGCLLQCEYLKPQKDVLTYGR